VLLPVAFSDQIFAKNTLILISVNINVRGNFGLMKTFSVFISGCAVKAFFGSQFWDFFQISEFRTAFSKQSDRPLGH